MLADECFQPFELSSLLHEQTFKAAIDQGNGTLPPTSGELQTITTKYAQPVSRFCEDFPKNSRGHRA